MMLIIIQSEPIDVKNNGLKFITEFASMYAPIQLIIVFIVILLQYLCIVVKKKIYELSTPPPPLRYLKILTVVQKFLTRVIFTCFKKFFLR